MFNKNFLLCDAEKTYILQGVEENYRFDGRQREDYRPMELETNIVLHAFGSARLRIASTDILVSVKVEIDNPFPGRPSEGKLEFFVDSCLNVIPHLHTKSGDDLAVRIIGALNGSYLSPQVFDLQKLCIVKGQKCWKLLVDILILGCGGNLFDAVFIAVKAALWNTRIPLIKNISVEANNIDIFASDRLSDCQILDVSKAPIAVTLCRIGEQYLVDSNITEEQCFSGRLVMVFSENKIACVLQVGEQSLKAETIVKYVNIGYKISKNLDQQLQTALTQMNSYSDVGFLK